MDTQLIDLHTHILPRMDDGSRSTQMSLQMLRHQAEQGVSVVCATPHYYASENSIAEFCVRREKAYRHLCDAVSDTSGYAGDYTRCGNGFLFRHKPLR